MPDRRITRAHIRDHLRRLWIIYLAGAVLALFLNHLAFTVTRPSFSDDETLKVMLLNADISLSEDELLARTWHLGFQAAETVPLAMAPGDANGEMLAVVQLISGFGDVYICDGPGKEFLDAREACLPLAGAAAEAAETLRRETGLHMAVMKNGTDLQRAISALPILAEMILE